MEQLVGRLCGSGAHRRSNRPSATPSKISSPTAFWPQSPNATSKARLARGWSCRTSASSALVGTSATDRPASTRATSTPEVGKFRKARTRLRGDRTQTT